ncbi:MAG: DUF3307 domain-containing protein [Cytophagaceae bacterium]|jgi:hypothetical protein|nr:DUF3307 domain-containing protein [Cytophagaceae bacterium]
MSSFTYIYLGLFFCHWLGDFTPLSTPRMLAAKAKGSPISIIGLHAVIHAVLMGLFLFLIQVPLVLIFYIIAFEGISHWLIDIVKGKLTLHFSSTLGNSAHNSYWMLFGADQLAHTIVILIIGQWVI